MVGAKRFMAGLGAVALVAASAVAGVGVPAQAASNGLVMTVTPNANLKGGDTISVTITGYKPGAAVAFGICPHGKKLTGPGDCGPSKKGASKLTAADSTGKVSGELTVIEGTLGASNYPTYKCGPTSGCDVASSDIPPSVGAATVVLNYAGSSKAAAAPAAKPKAKAKVKAAKHLAKTGPRETLFIGLAGIALLQLGLVFAVRASRSAPRRTAA